MAQARRPISAPETTPPPRGPETTLPPRGPEKKIGPFAGGIGVAVWLNTIENDDGGTRKDRSITLSPRWSAPRFFLHRPTPVFQEPS